MSLDMAVCCPLRWRQTLKYQIISLRLTEKGSKQRKMLTANLENLVQDVVLADDSAISHYLTKHPHGLCTKVERLCGLSIEARQGIQEFKTPF